MFPRPRPCSAPPHLRFELSPTVVPIEMTAPPATTSHPHHPRPVPARGSTLPVNAFGTAQHVNYRSTLNRTTALRATIEDELRSMETLQQLAWNRGRVDLEGHLRKEVQRLRSKVETARKAEQMAMSLVREGGGSARKFFSHDPSLKVNMLTPWTGLPNLLSPVSTLTPLFPASGHKLTLLEQDRVLVTELRYVPGHIITHDLGIVYAAASNRERVPGGSIQQLQRLKDRLRAAARLKGGHAVMGVVLSYDRRYVFFFFFVKYRQRHPLKL